MGVVCLTSSVHLCPVFGCLSVHVRFLLVLPGQTVDTWSPAHSHAPIIYILVYMYMYVHLHITIHMLVYSLVGGAPA